MKTSKLIIISVFILATLAIFIGGILLVSNGSASPQISTSQNAKAKTDSFNYDFGEAKYKAGNHVIKTFTIKNSGTDNLKLFNIKTSCHCTKALVKTNSDESPYFGMNTVSSWVGEVKPNQEAKLIVDFDQSYHGEAGIGPITRFVSVETNDAANQKLEFTLSGTVVK